MKSCFRKGLLLCLGLLLALPAGAGAAPQVDPAPVLSPEKDLKAMLLTRYGTPPEKPATCTDPHNGVTFTLPRGFKLQGVYGRGKDHQDILIRAGKGDALLVYMANGAMMKTEGQAQAKPFQSEKVMLDITYRTYAEEAKAKGLAVEDSALGTFAGRDGIHIRQVEDGKLSDRYFFADRKNLYSFTLLAPEKELTPELEQAFQGTLDSLKIPTAYERVELPHSGVSYEIPYGSVDIQKAADPGDLHQLARLHLDNQLITGVIYKPLQDYLEYAYLPDSLTNLGPQDKENLCRLMTENRRAQWARTHPGLALKKNETYFAEKAGRPCIVEEEVTPGGKSLGYVFLQDGMFLSLDYMQLGEKDQQDVIDHSVDSLKWTSDASQGEDRKGTALPSR